MENLKGIVPPVITPFKDEEVDLAAFKANIAKWNNTALSGYLVVGSNGEAAYLNEKEREDILAAAKETAAADKFIMAGTGAAATGGLTAGKLLQRKYEESKRKNRR